MAQRVAEGLESIGMDTVRIDETDGYPIVFAEKKISDDLPTVLVYGHYDVQPPDPEKLWISDAFHPVIRKTEIHPGGAIFARGACDDKGQVFIHLKALEYLISQGKLQCNVKVIIEGEEEIGSIHLEKYITDHKGDLFADAVLISDSAMISFEDPSLCLGLRGLCSLDIELTGPSRDLHSGEYGGAVGNPIHALSTMIHRLHDENGAVNVPGFYDRVCTLSDADRKSLNYDSFSDEDYRKTLEIRSTFGEKGYSTLERTGIRPTLEINGIWGGYTGEGSKTVLPSKAYAKISTRLVPDQRGVECAELLKKHLEMIAPDYVDIKVTVHSSGNPSVVHSDSNACRAASKAMEDVFGKAPIYTRGGGSIPVVETFKRVCNLNTVLLGFGFDSDSIHSPNEHFGVENFDRGVRTVVHFYRYFHQLQTSS